MVPFAVIFVAVSSAARAFGGEVENRTIGLVMSTPTRRTRLATDKVVAMVVHVAHGGGDHGPGPVLGIVVAGIDISTGNIVAITLMVTLLSVSVGGLAMVISIVTGRGTLAILVGMLVAVAMYAWSSFVPMADAIADLAWLVAMAPLHRHRPAGQRHRLGLGGAAGRSWRRSRWS